MSYLGLNENKTQEVVSGLNILLANYHVYYQRLRNFHWNIKGRHFFVLHEKFEELYNDAKVKIDDIAERILTLRSKPVSWLSDYLDMSELEEDHTELNDIAMANCILNDHTVLIKNMRSILTIAEEVHDEGTVDMISGFLADMEKNSWMIDAWRMEQTEKPAHSNA